MLCLFGRVFLLISLQDRFAAILDLPNLVLVALQATIKHLSSFNLTSMFLESESYVSFAQQSAMSLSGNTLANLEVLRNATDFTSRGSLLSIVDSCKTAFGRRLLRRWLTRPLLSLEKIRERADAVDELVKSNSLTVSKLTSLLKAMPDLERGLIRIHIGKATPIELVSVLWAFQRIGDVFAGLSDPQNALDTTLLRQIAKSLPAASREAKTFLSQIDTTAARQNKKEDMFVDSDATEDLFVSSKPLGVQSLADLSFVDRMPSAIFRSFKQSSKARWKDVGRRSGGRNSSTRASRMRIT